MALRDNAAPQRTLKKTAAPTLNPRATKITISKAVSAKIAAPVRIVFEATLSTLP